MKGYESKESESSVSLADDFASVFTSTVTLLILGAIGIVGWQLYTYLKLGEWHSISVITAMRWCEIKWSFSPTGWLGLYEILDFVPLSIAVFCAAIAVLFAGIIFSSE